MFAMKSSKARELGISKLSDLGQHWTAAPAAVARAARDERQDEQWAIAPDSVLDLPDAWGLSQGAGVTVAIVDSGIKLDHPDLGPNAWTNFAEVPGNGVDDDGNGYVDDVHGVDLTTTSPGRTSATDTATARTSRGSWPPLPTAAASSASPRGPR